MSKHSSPGQRVSAVRFPGSYDLPVASESAPGDVLDAHRQSRFLLRADLRLFEEGMRLQLRFVKEASHSSFRTHAYAAMIGLWSRAFLALSDACLLVTGGSYGSSLPLIRTTCEYVAAQRQLHDGEMQQFLDWLAGSLSPEVQRKAVDVGLGRLVAAGTPADDERLGNVYRPAVDLSRPNFGSTLLLVGPESNNQRLALAFADNAFHFGWAQLVLGWLLVLCERQIAVVCAAGDLFGDSDERGAQASDFARRVGDLLDRPDRCWIEEIEESGARRYLVHNFRRTPGGAARKLLL